MKDHVHLQLVSIIFYNLQTENWTTLGGKFIAIASINFHELVFWPIWRNKNTAKHNGNSFVMICNFPFYFDSLSLLLCCLKFFFLSNFYPFLSLWLNLSAPFCLRLVPCHTRRLTLDFHQQLFSSLPCGPCISVLTLSNICNSADESIHRKLFWCGRCQTVATAF